MRLSTHVYLVCGSMYGSHQNVYAIDTGQSLILIDTGLNEKDWQIIQDNLSYWQLAERPVRYVLLTHEHYEHTNNAWLWQQQGAKIIAHQHTAQAIAVGGDAVADYVYVDQGPFHVCQVDQTFSDADQWQLDQLEMTMIHVPGHSLGSVLYLCTVDQETMVFSGDAILVTTLCHKAAFGKSIDLHYDPYQYQASMKKISQIQADKLLPGHGEICLRHASKMFTGAYLASRQTFASHILQKD